MDDSIGVDVSKDNLDVHRLSVGTSARFANTSAGFRDLAKWMGSEPPARVVYEPTGPYHAAFETRFAGRLPLVKVNPLQARRFAQSKGMRAKTDRVDARMRDRLAVKGDLTLDEIVVELAAVHGVSVHRGSSMTRRSNAGTIGDLAKHEGIAPS